MYLVSIYPTIWCCPGSKHHWLTSLRQSQIKQDFFWTSAGHYRTAWRRLWDVSKNSQCFHYVGILWNGEIKGNSTAHCQNLVLLICIWNLNFNPRMLVSVFKAHSPFEDNVTALGRPNTSLHGLTGLLLGFIVCFEETTFWFLYTLSVGVSGPQTCVFCVLFELYHNTWKTRLRGRPHSKG